MGYIEFDKSIRTGEWDMTNLHSHSHYELYFLTDGTRKFFLKDRMYKITGPCLIVIPPYTMHKTEGNGFTRYNVNFAKDNLTKYEENVLDKLSLKTLPLLEEHLTFFTSILEEGQQIQENSSDFTLEKLNILLGYIILKMDKIDVNPMTALVKNETSYISPVVLKMIDYIMEHLNDKLDLDILSELFYLSKTSICHQFKMTMNCTIGEYITRLRLNKAKELLITTNKSVEEVSYECGFCSPAYLGIVFKSKVGLSPLNYRKAQKNKT